MYKIFSLVVILIFAVAGYVYSDGMGLNLDMGMSTGGEVGGSFPEAPTNALKGSDGAYVKDSTGAYIVCQS